MRLYQNDASWTSAMRLRSLMRLEFRFELLGSPLACEGHQTLLFTIYARIMLPLLAPASALSVADIYCDLRRPPFRGNPIVARRPS